MSDNKVTKYIGSFPTKTKTILETIRADIKKILPDAEETIAYGMPTYRVNGKNLVHFAGYKGHIGLYPSPSGITAFEKELSSYRWAKGSVRFPLENDIPYELIKKIVEYRLAEVSNKK